MTWTREELETAFRHYQDTVQRAADTGDWNLFVGLFTEDAHYNEHSYGFFRGREEIRAWALRTMGTFPGNAMPGFPIAWYVIDADRGWIVCEIRNLMRDPGDGSLHEASNYTKLHYAGDNLWSLEEDVYNPLHFHRLVTGWARAADAHGTLRPDERAWLERFAPGWSAPGTTRPA